MTAIKNTLTIKVGRKSHPIADYAEASRMTLAAVAALAEREHRVGPHFKSPLIYEGGRQVAYVSQNGHVWAGNPREWKPGATPLCEAQYPA
ncbi:MAG: hypothetical protein EBR82_87615 [Caulobacteraceae bacterium]|nr:hypothetical protein [Caulobacteraceae bacterium]